MYRPKMSGTSKLLWALIWLGFMIMTFPGVLFFHAKAYPFIFGMPFIYGFIIFMWAYMCIILFIAPRLNWGVKREKGGDAK